MANDKYGISSICKNQKDIRSKEFENSTKYFKCRNMTDNLSSLKESIDSALSIGIILETSPLVNYHDMPFNELIRLELIKFGLYLNSLKIPQAREDKAFIKELLNYDEYDEIPGEAINHANITGTWYFSDIPKSIMILTELDKQAGTKVCKLLIDAYKSLGDTMLSHNLTNETWSIAVEGYYSFILMLIHYVQSYGGYLVSAQIIRTDIIPDDNQLFNAMDFLSDDYNPFNSIYTFRKTKDS